MNQFVFEGYKKNRPKRENMDMKTHVHVCVRLKTNRIKVVCMRVTDNRGH